MTGLAEDKGQGRAMTCWEVGSCPVEGKAGGGHHGGEDSIPTLGLPPELPTTPVLARGRQTGQWFTHFLSGLRSLRHEATGLGGTAPSAEAQGSPTDSLVPQPGQRWEIHQPAAPACPGCSWGSIGHRGQGEPEGRAWETPGPLRQQLRYRRLGLGDSRATLQRWPSTAF